MLILSRIGCALAISCTLSCGYSYARETSSKTVVELGRLGDGGEVSFSRAGNGEWGVAVRNSSESLVRQPRPVQFEIFQTEEDIRHILVGYRSVEKRGTGVIAHAEVSYGPAVIFRVEDDWSLDGSVLSVNRILHVSGSTHAGFDSGISLSTSSAVRWQDIKYFLPAVLYAGPGPNDESGPGGTAAFRTRNVEVREDALPAPMLGLLLGNGTTVSVLDPSPKGDTTEEDTRAKIATVLVDARFRYGAFGVHGIPSGGVDFGFWYPGGITGSTGAKEDPLSRPGPGIVRRYSPVQDGFSQEYRLSFRFGQHETFRTLTKNDWRWAWKALDPPVSYLDVELVRHTLLDHLADRVLTVDGRSGIPWITQVTTGEVWHRPDDLRAVMGFCGKNIELADELLLEGDRDPSARGQRMRQLGLAIIESFIQLVPMSPPAGEGFDLTTGKPSLNLPASSWRGNLSGGERLYLRAPSEDLRRLMEAYLREKKAGRDHPDWLSWCKGFADWLLPQQRADGSFPRSWRPGTSTVVEPSGTGSYDPVPLFLLLGNEGGPAGDKYLRAAIRAADLIWQTQGEDGVFIGGTMDNPDVVDKEAGALALEAFLSLFETTHDPKWLSRAQAAATFAETWIWIWNVPMPKDADDAQLHWKRGVPTVGLQGVTVRGAGGCDEYLDWSVPSFAKLYKYTNDVHYLDVARVLLHDTKGMLALPGRTYDMAGPGWQQENFNLSTHRGYGSHRGWLAWISAGHLWSIDGLEAFDPALYKQLSSNPQDVRTQTETR